MVILYSFRYAAIFYRRIIDSFKYQMKINSQEYTKHYGTTTTKQGTMKSWA